MAGHTYLALAIMVIAAHLLFNIWVVFGAAVTRDRPKLTALHIGSVIYGATMENTSWPCPLTLVENWCKVRAGLGPYEGSFVLHYLPYLVAPRFPLWLLQWGAIGMGLANLAVYAHRYLHVFHQAAQPLPPSFPGDSRTVS